MQRFIFSFIFWLLGMFPHECPATSVFSQTVLFIYGTSCAGKSCLAKRLLQELGPEWTLISRDAIIEKRKQELSALFPSFEENRRSYRKVLDEIEAHADNYLKDEIELSLQQNLNVIVDTQLHKPVREMLQSCQNFAILVYAPLSCLIARDDHRSQLLNRPKRCQFYARAYIFETFAQLYKLERRAGGLDVLNSTHFNQEMLDYCVAPDTYAFFNNLLQAESECSLFNQEPYDILIKSHQQSLQESVELILHQLQTLLSSNIK